QRTRRGDGHYGLAGDCDVAGGSPLRCHHIAAPDDEIEHQFTASATTRADSIVTPPSSSVPILLSLAIAFQACSLSRTRAGGPTSDVSSISASGAAAAAASFLPPRKSSCTSLAAPS